MAFDRLALRALHVAFVSGMRLHSVAVIAAASFIYTGMGGFRVVRACIDKNLRAPLNDRA
jgi:hypothetical protein